MEDGGHIREVRDGMPNTERMDEDAVADAEQAMDAATSGILSSEVLRRYDERHGIETAPKLIVMNDQTTHALVAILHDRIVGRTVVEVGAGIGLLTLHMGTVARRVFAIEASPVWSSAFIATLMAGKPRNVSFICGDAGGVRRHHKGRRGAILLAFRDRIAQEHRLAPGIPGIDVYGEMIDANPAGFDQMAQDLRQRS